MFNIQEIASPDVKQLLYVLKKCRFFFNFIVERKFWTRLFHWKRISVCCHVSDDRKFFFTIRVARYWGVFGFSYISKRQRIQTCGSGRFCFIRRTNVWNFSQFFVSNETKARLSFCSVIRLLNQSLATMSPASHVHWDSVCCSRCSVVA